MGPLRPWAPRPGPWWRSLRLSLRAGHDPWGRPGPLPAGSLGRDGPAAAPCERTAVNRAVREPGAPLCQARAVWGGKAQGRVGFCPRTVRWSGDRTWGRAGHVGRCWTHLLAAAHRGVRSRSGPASRRRRVSWSLPPSTDDACAERALRGVQCLSPRRVRGPWGGGKASMHREPWAPQDLLGGGCCCLQWGSLRNWKTYTTDTRSCDTNALLFLSDFNKPAGVERSRDHGSCISASSPRVTKPGHGGRCGCSRPWRRPGTGSGS